MRHTLLFIYIYIWFNFNNSVDYITQYGLHIFFSFATKGTMSQNLQLSSF